MRNGNEAACLGWPRQKGEMADLIRSHDWAASPLGPVEAWPATLRNAVDLMLDSRQPVYLGWGPDLTSLYNEGYVAFLGDRHPWALGKPYAEVWPEITGEYAPILQAVMAGEAQHFVDRPVPLRGPNAPPRWFTFSWTPLRDDSGEVAGFYCPATETTERMRKAVQLEHNETRYRALFDAIDQGFAVIQVLFDETGRAADFRLLEVNAAFQRQTGFTDVVGRTALELAPDHETAWFDIYGRIARTGVPERFERFLAITGRYYEVYAFPAGGAEDNTVGVLFNDIGERKRAERSLQESEENLRLIVENARDYAIFTTDCEGRVTAWYDGAAMVFGYRADEIVGRDLAILYTDEDREAGEPEGELARARRNGSTPNVRWHLRADGSRVFIEGAAAALWGGNGELRGFLKIGQDVTERQRAQAALRRSRREMRTLLEGIPQLVWRSRDDGDWIWASPQWVSFTGLSVEESCGLGWLGAVHPDDRERARSAWSKARDAKGFNADYRIRDAATGRYRWFQTRATPSGDEDGETAEWFGTSTDVDDLRRLQEHERLLLAELQHRVRNTLAVIRSIARRTADTTETAEDYAMHLEGRIDAFARVQAAATRDPAAGISLLDLVAEELVAATAREGENVAIEGPDTRLPAREAETFGLAVHELATNAIKYGALSEPGGHIDVRWNIEATGDRPLLHFVWKETGVRLDPEEPRRRGFGTELIERTLSYQLRAEAKETFEPDGVRCIIRMPLPPAGAERPSPGETLLLED